MGRIKILEKWLDRESCTCELFVCLRDNPIGGQPASMTLHVKGLDLQQREAAVELLQIGEPNEAPVLRMLSPWQVQVPDELLRRLRSRVLALDTDFESDLGGLPISPKPVIAKIQPEFLAPAVAGEIASRMHWPVTKLQMAECIARACADGNWPAPVVHLSSFSVGLQFEGERLRLLRIGADGKAGDDLKAAERIRYVRDCDAGRFSISTPAEVFICSDEPSQAVEILKEVGRLIGAQPYEDSPCFEDEPSPARARCAAMRG